MIRLNIGCGEVLLKNWLNIDLYEDNPEVIKMDIRKLDYSDNYADEILAHMCLEHFPQNETVPTLKEWHRVLKPGGKITIATSDLDGMVRDWLDKDGIFYDMDGNPHDYTYNLRGIYGQQCDEGQFHYIGFDFPYLHKLMTEAGFIKINLLPTNHTHHLYVEGRK
jgi:predicted SAM-dependent methyltransferase